MFDRVFKRKDEPTVAYTELARRSRVDKQKAADYIGRRPRTAPPSTNPALAAQQNHVTKPFQRHSLGDESAVPHRVPPLDTRFMRTIAPAGTNPSPPQMRPSSVKSMLPPPTHPSQTPLTPPTPPSNPSCHGLSAPRMVPSTPTSPPELHNPFRSGTNDSTPSMSRAGSTESFADTGVPVHRTVRAFRSAPTMGSAIHQPQKAAIFTAGATERQLEVPPAATAPAMSDPFTDAHACSQPASPSVSAVGTSSHPDEPRTQRPSSRDRPWSILRSPKRGSQDFLQVQIPTGVMSPVRDSRHAFWSKA
ncbi:hypothetical protein BD413DRAFT_22217 [Trametes elegans]|nr:hypothetical protein BD413DRAFT_22217 [Trametes elegans]